MKTTLLLLTLVIAFIALPTTSAFSHDRDRGCEDQDRRDCKHDPVKAPEPGSLALLAAGLTAVGYLAIRQKRARAKS